MPRAMMLTILADARAAVIASESGELPARVIAWRKWGAAVRLWNIWRGLQSETVHR